MIVASKYKLTKASKAYISVFTILIMILSCSKHNVISQQYQKNVDFSLSESEIKYIYHEAVRRLFYEKNLLTLALTMNDFYEMKELDGTLINCGDKNFEFIVSDRIENIRIVKYFENNKMNINERIDAVKHLKTMEFYFQLKIYFANIDENKVSLKSPKMGYFVFSDIFRISNGLYYIEATLTSRLTCEDLKVLYTGWNYTFEIERCSSGFLRFKKVIVGDGKEVPSSLGPISSIFELTDTEKCR